MDADVMKCSLVGFDTQANLTAQNTEYIHSQDSYIQYTLTFSEPIQHQTSVSASAYPLDPAALRGLALPRSKIYINPPVFRVGCECCWTRSQSGIPRWMVP
jgi:hypothetical protein